MMALSSVVLAGIGLFLSSSSLAQSPPPPDVVHIPLQRSQDNQRYVAMVNMSTTNTQRFGFALCTTTGYTIVANSSCADCSSKNIPTYNSNQSITAAPIGSGHQQQIVSIAGGAVNAGTGTLSKENCALHQANGSFWQYPNQTLVQATDSPVFQPGVSGIIGLGLNAPFDDTPFGGWLRNNPQQHNITFGLALNPLPAVTTQNTVPDAPSDEAGTLHMLQPDPASYTGEIRWHGVQDGSDNSSSWMIQMDGWNFKSGGAQASNALGGVASIEPYFSSIFLPASQANLLYASIPGAEAITRAPTDVGQLYSIPCDSDMTFSVVLGGQEYPISSEGLVLHAPDGTCVGAIEGWADPTTTTFMLGSRFISTVYVVFQTGRPPTAQQQVGIAMRLSTARSAKTNVGAIAGGTVGGVVFVLLLAGAVFWFVRRGRRRRPVPAAPPIYEEASEKKSARVSPGIDHTWAPEMYHPPPKSPPVAHTSVVPEPYGDAHSTPASPRSPPTSPPATATSQTGFLEQAQPSPTVKQWVRDRLPSGGGSYRNTLPAHYNYENE